MPATPRSSSRARARHHLLRQLSAHGSVDDGLGLLFFGNSGVGKTHLAVVRVAGAVDRKGARGQFCDFHELIREIKNSYNPETRTTELQILEPVIDIDILLLDDLGAWKLTGLDAGHAVLHPERSLHGQESHLHHDQLSRRHAAGASDANNRRGEVPGRADRHPALRSRLLEMCTVISMAGPTSGRSARRGAARGWGGQPADVGSGPSPASIRQLRRDGVPVSPGLGRGGRAHARVAPAGGSGTSDARDQATQRRRS